MKNAVLKAWSLVFGRPCFARLNRFFFYASLRGLGVLNYTSLVESGERHFLRKALARYSSSQQEAASWIAFDVGANVGTYTREVLSIAPSFEVFCFEPHPRNVERLRRAVEPRATVVARAVGSQEGSLELFDYREGDGSSHASVYKEVFEKIHKRAHVAHRVDVVTIDGFMDERRLSRIALLKIDTEGHELAVLQGAAKALQRDLIDMVHFEFNEMNIASRTFLSDFFEALPNFTFYRLLRNGWLPLRGVPLENLFAYQNIVAVRRGSRAEAAFR